MRRPKDGNLRVLVANFHVGLGIKYGAIAYIVGHLPWLNLMLIQEARNGEALRRALGDKWGLWPHEQPGERKDNEAMSYVAYRKRRFLFVDGSNEDISFQGRDPYPRRAPVARLYDRRTQRAVVAGSVHTVPMAPDIDSAPANKRFTQLLQLRHYRDEADSFVQDGLRVLGGDFNQDLSIKTERLVRELRVYSAHRILLDWVAASRVKGGYVKLMDLFLRRTGAAHIARRLVFRLPIRGMDHEVVYVRVFVHKKGK